MPDKPTLAKGSLLFILAAGLFYPVISHLIYYCANNPDYSHCFLVPFVSLFYAVKLFPKNGDVGNAGGKGALAALIACVFLYLISLVGGIVFIQRVAMVFTIHALVAFNFGWLAYRKLLFPLVFLFLMIPLPETIHGMIAFPLQLFATKMSALALRAIEIPVYKAGNILHLQAGALEVVEACSGIRSLLSFFTLGVFFAYLDQKGWVRRGVLIALSIPVAVVANIARVTFSGFIGQVYGMRLARGFMHEFSGFALFFLGLILMFLLSTLIQAFIPPKEERINVE